MNKKEKLLNSLDGLEMSFKKKQEFVNALVGDSVSDSNGSSDWEYIDISGLSEQYKTALINFAGMLLKINIDETIIIASGGVTAMYQSSAILSGALAVGYIPTVKIDMGQQGKGTIQYFIEQLENMNITLPRITKEEFYNLNSDSNENNTPPTNTINPIKIYEKIENDNGSYSIRDYAIVDQDGTVIEYDGVQTSVNDDGQTVVTFTNPYESMLYVEGTTQPHTDSNLPEVIGTVIEDLGNGKYVWQVDVETYRWFALYDNIVAIKTTFVEQ